MNLKKLEIIEIDINKIKEYENNSKEHPEWHIKQIAESIRAFGFNDPIAVNKDFQIIAGHGRYRAGLILKLKKIPCIILEGLTEAEERAYIITHNKLTMNTGFDLDKLIYEINSLKVDGEIDLTLTGFSKEEIDNLLSGINTDYKEILDDNENEDRLGDNEYSLKIEAPIYEPKNEKPKINEMINFDKYNELLKEIEKADLPEEEKNFLKFAATRHIIFDYEKIADYYTNSDKKVQEYMENSALVIIDFEKAIENGFVEMSRETMEKFGVDNNE